MEIKIALVPGDGIGPEVVSEAVKVLKRIGEIYGHSFKFSEYKAGGSAIDTFGEPLPNETIKGCRLNDSILLGAVGGPKWDEVSSDKRPERAILGLRKEFGLYANLRPAILFSELKDASPLKESIISKGLDLMVVRELTGGIYFGDKKTEEINGIVSAFDVERYSVSEIERIAHTAFKMAMKRGKKVTSVDKSNVLESSRLWRKTVIEVSKQFPEITLSHFYVDNCAMQLVMNPGQFDVIVTSNLFGDILSDEASVITGSIGLLPSASLNESGFGLYEPVHGSAPDIAGKNIANPIATILSAAMMLKYSFDMEEESSSIEKAVKKILASGYRTADIVTENTSVVGTKEMGDLIVNELSKQII
ncbi:MAG: 3-isopropylmalate dehydrogenase [Clostridiaceae bacterium]